MVRISPPFVLVRWIALGVCVALAGCATSHSPAGGAPHNKVGSPYEINGRWYYPKDDPHYEAVGVASWYGEQFHGRRTANGEIFDEDRLSAAHTTLPLPSLVEVRNLENGRTIVVRVNDRGPFAGERLIDLSRAAAEALGFRNKGLARVKVRYLGRADLFARAEPGGRYSTRMGKASPALIAAAPPLDMASDGANPPADPAAAASSTKTEKAGIGADIPADAADNREDALASFIGEALAAPPPEEIWIAVGAYDDLNSLEAARLTLPPLGETRVVMAPHDEGAIRYELQIGPEFDPESADARLAALREAGYPEARIVDDARLERTSPTAGKSAIEPGN